MMREGLILLEENIPLSRSRLWDWQAAFFAKTGVEAWAGAVPFYVTSNPVIAYSYAQVIARYIQDLARQPNFDAGRPVYIIELGAGSGRFSYYCLRHLVRLYQSLRLPLMPCFVMTDFAQANLDFWQQQPQLKPFIEEGFLDMALFNVDSPAAMTLQHRARVVSPDEPGQAVICLANYVFDSTRHDVFRVTGKGLREGLIELKAPPTGLPQGAPPALADISLLFTLRAINPASYYPNPVWNAILTDYCRNEHLDGHFVFPTAMFRALELLERLGSGRLLLLSSDKGYTLPHQIMGRAAPQLKLHGSCFSLTVNFDAVRRYVQVKGGLSFHQPLNDGLRTCVYVLGDTLDALPETVTACSYFTQQCGPYDFWLVDQQLRKSTPLSLPACIAHLRCAHWDPHLVSVHLVQLLDGIKQARDDCLREALHEGLPLAEQLIYPLPGMRDHYFDLAMLHDALGDHRSAIRLLRISAERFPPGFPTYFNLGLSHYKAGDIPAAVLAFENASKYEGESRTAEAWRQKLLPMLARKLPGAHTLAGRRLARS